MSLDAALEALNSRLKGGGNRCVLEQRRSALFLRATLPARDDPAQRRQQRIPLGLQADYKALPEAESKAIDLGRQLRTGTFSWDAWESGETLKDSGILTARDFHAAAEKLHASKYRKDPERGANAWSKKWSPALRKLPKAGPINERILLRIVNSMPEGSAGRRDQGNLLAQIAKLIGIPHEGIQAACRGYGVDKLSEREIPTDCQIEVAMQSIRLPHWKWTFGMCAAFGLRPHECAELEWIEDDWIRIGDATKTGSRTVTACPSQWLDDFSLRSLPRPPQSPQTIAKVFLDALDRDEVTIRPYALRHAFAIRLMEKKVPPEYGARLMGHSLQVHEQTYKRWLEADRITRAMSSFNL